MRRQVCQFYDTNMEKNKVEDWIKLLLYTTCQDKEILGKVLAKTRILHTAHDVIDYVEAEECGRENAARLLGGKDIAARMRGQQGGSGGGGVRCYACQSPGHSKPECTVEKSKLWCQYCKKRGIHNTNRFCRAFKNGSDEKDKTEKGKTDPKDVKKKRVNKARTVNNTEKEETPEDEEDEDSDSVPFILSRIQWFPLEEADSEGDSEGEFETSNDTDVFFLDSEFETEDNSSEDESGYYTPPNTPEEEDEISLLTEDEDENPLLTEDEEVSPRSAEEAGEESDLEDDSEAEPMMPV